MLEQSAGDMCSLNVSIHFPQIDMSPHNTETLGRELTRNQDTDSLTQHPELA